MRVLGVDFGRSRIGLAVVDTASGLPRPLGTIPASGTLSRDAEAISHRATSEEADRVVVGLPLDLSGETPMSRVCRMLGERLSGLGLDVRFVDESMTSQAAEQTLQRQGLRASQIKRHVDAQAACAILDRYMSEHGQEE